MARKLHIFDPGEESRTDLFSLWRELGGFAGGHVLPGVLLSRMLGVGNIHAPGRTPQWLHTSARLVKLAARGASRADQEFWGWG